MLQDTKYRQFGQTCDILQTMHFTRYDASISKGALGICYCKLRWFVVEHSLNIAQITFYRKTGTDGQKKGALQHFTGTLLTISGTFQITVKSYYARTASNPSLSHTPLVLEGWCTQSNLMLGL